MYRTIHIHTILLLAGLLFVACSGSKSYAKKAGKLDEAGLYAEAADMYLQAVQRNTKNVDAKIGLKKTGQQVVNDKLGTFFRSLNTSTDKAATVDAYLEAQEFVDRVGRLGVALSIPDHQRAEFERVKGEHVVELYSEGQALLEKQEFASAEERFKRIAKLEPGYKDANSLRTIAFVEPLYRQGSADLAAGQYRKAYDQLDQVVQKDAGYKDAAKLRSEALTKGQYSIAVLPFNSSTKLTDVAMKMQAYAITALTEAQDPFLRVVDRENIERILEEQRLGLSGVVDEQTAVRVGNLIGAQAVLMGTVIDHKEYPGALKRSTKEGFESVKEKKRNPETGESYIVTTYKPVSYTEYLLENRVVTSISYKLVSLETGEVLLSHVIDDEMRSNAYYADYSGNKENLLPVKNGAVDLNDRSRRELAGLLKAPREATPIATLSNDLLRGSGKKIGVHIEQRIASLIP